MGWAVGIVGERFIGYGVPAVCDHPDCDKRIDRGLAYRCGEGRVDSCELYFCGDHLEHYVPYDEEAVSRNSRDDGGWVCTRCYHGATPFDPKPDVREWIEHVLAHPTWEEWRRDHPVRVEVMRKAVTDGAS